MKTKAYKLAAELGLQEQSVLDWLRHNGYPNARRADTIRAEVAQAARHELGRRRTADRSNRRTRRTESHRQPERRGGNDARSTGELRVSFAELLEGHLPTATDSGRSAVPPSSATSPGMPAMQPESAPAPASAASIDEALSLRLARAERERDESRAQLAAMQRSYQAVSERNEGLRDAGGRVDELQRKVEQLQLDRTTLRQRMEAVADERATLEQTCAELQTELAETRAELSTYEVDTSVQDSMAGELESAMQREMAWRTRALELERAAHVGGNLGTLLTDAGATDLRQQARVLQAMLASRESAVVLIRAIRQVDAQALAKLMPRTVQRTCAHPVCNQVTALDERVPLRVDHDADCEVCKGDAAHRWFSRMVRECGRSGVRRLLVVGGDPVHERLRGLSQGEPVDLRLVNDGEAAHAARVQGRIEGCDLLVVWSGGVVSADVSEPYASVARDAGRPIVSVLGERSEVVPLARAVCNRLARNHVLRAT